MATGTQADEFSKKQQFMFVFRNDIDSLVAWVKEGGDVNEPESFHGTTLLMQAAHNGFRGIVRYLLSLGVEIDKVDHHGQTALFFAAFGGQEEVVQDLLDRGADMLASNSNGLNPVTVAILHEKHEVLKIFDQRIDQRNLETGNDEQAKPIIPETKDLSTDSLALLQQITDPLEYNQMWDLVTKMHSHTSKTSLEPTAIWRVNISQPRKTKYKVCQKTMISQGHRLNKFYTHNLHNIDEAIKNGFIVTKSFGSHLPAKYGLGLYFTTDPTVTLQKPSKDKHYLLYCEVAIGKYWTIHCPMPHLTSSEVTERGYDSVFGLGDSQKTGGSQHDEFVVYNPSQAMPLYLIEVECIERQQNTGKETKPK